MCFAGKTRARRVGHTVKGLKAHEVKAEWTRLGSNERQGNLYALKHAGKYPMQVKCDVMEVRRTKKCLKLLESRG